MEELYPKALIRRTVKAIHDGLAPATVNQVIDKVDVEVAVSHLPTQFQKALEAWLDSLNEKGNPDWDDVSVALHTDIAEAEASVRAAWDYLWSLLNED